MCSLYRNRMAESPGVIAMDFRKLPVPVCPVFMPFPRLRMLAFLYVIVQFVYDSCTIMYGSGLKLQLHDPLQLNRNNCTC